MKRNILTAVAFTIFIINSGIVLSQVVTENISFDQYVSPTNNDFVNYFTNGLGLTQITALGITGGCLTTPNTVSWGNDNAIYCSKYLNAPGNISTTKICFRYDTTQIMPISYQRAVSIFLRPSVDFNHYVIASINYDSKLQIVSYSWVNNMPVVNLLHNHWYEFILTTEILSASPTWQMTASAQVNDLGLTGQLPPIPAGSSTGTFSDSILTVDPAVEVSFTTTQWGGAKFADNFSFNGVKSPNSCSVTSVENVAVHEWSVIQNEKNISIRNCKAGSLINLFSSDGSKVFSGTASGNSYKMDVSLFNTGIYFLRVSDNKNSGTVKIAVVN